MYCNLKEKIILKELQVVRKWNIICQIGIIIIFLVYRKLGLLGPYNRLSCLHLITADMKLRNYIKQMQQQQRRSRMFSRKGIPGIVRSGNFPQYNSRKFEKFAIEWGFRYIPSSPKYPRTNGLAEKTVQTAKNLKKTKKDNKESYLAMLEITNTPVDN